MPQLDFANPLTISQVVWLVVIFAVMYLLLSRWALPKVGTVIAHRGARIAEDLDRARESKSAADAARQDATDTEQRARAAAQAQINDAIATAKRDAAAHAAELNQRLDAKLAQSEQAIDAARRQAWSGLRGIATGVAATMIERLTGTPPNETTLDQAITTLTTSQPA